MAKFVFAADLRPLLERGTRRIELDPGTRLSPSAAELLRDYGAEVVFAPPAGTKAGRAGEPAETGPEPEQPRREKPEPKKTSPAETAPQEGGVSEAEVEEILERVLRRLEGARGGAAETREGKTARPGQTRPGQAGSAEDDDLIICRCEEITKGQIREALRNGISTLNGVKRVTRAGMGLCQGQTCQRLVTAILAQELGLSPQEVEPVTARPPTRPVPLEVLATGSPGIS